jgi:hypothetical protein
METDPKRHALGPDGLQYLDIARRFNTPPRIEPKATIGKGWSPVIFIENP